MGGVRAEVVDPECSCIRKYSMLVILSHLTNAHIADTSTRNNNLLSGTFLRFDVYDARLSSVRRCLYGTKRWVFRHREK